MRELSLSTLRVRRLRNVAEATLDLGPRFNVIFGDNGQGKTTILEAVFLLCTARSFRTKNVLEMVTLGASEGSAAGTFSDAGLSRRHAVSLERSARIVRVDDKRPKTLAAYARMTPVVVFHPGEMAISQGGGGERRRILDRVGLYAREAAGDAVLAYGKAQRTRQRVLETRGARSPELDDYEPLVVRHGLQVMADRARAAEEISPLAESAFRSMARGALSLVYAPSAPRDPAEFAAALRARRDQDLRRGSSGVGPHRDDLTLTLDGRDARTTASQGQHRAIVIALKLAEIDALTHVTGARPILLLDDVSSELDHDRLSALFALLGERYGQTLLTTTRRDLGRTALLGESSATQFRMIAGEVLPG